MNIPNLPAWYWPWGLHDAIIDQAIRCDRPQWIDGTYYHNSLTLSLDPRNALWDTTVSTITLLNYKVLSDDFDPTGCWWLSDTLRQVNSKYLLEIQLGNYEKHKAENKTYTVRFTHCIVERLPKSARE